MLHNWSLKKEMCVCLGVQPYSPSVSPHITVEPLLLPWITPSLAEPASVRENAVSIFLQNCHKLQINQLSSCAWLKNWRKLEDAQPTCALLKTETYEKYIFYDGIFQVC